MYTPVSSGNLLTVDTGSNVTPRTPEILNSLIAMTNPLDCSLQERQQREATTPTNSVQQTCSQLIKAGLKLSIQSKRKHSTSESCSGSKFEYSGTTGSEDDYDDERMSPVQGLTPEDEERRRRRRERNKIAATKCRQKKRERTVNLVSESAVLETQNVDLKTQIRELDAEVRQLVNMLSGHSPSCLRKQSDCSRQSSYANFCTSTDQIFLQTSGDSCYVTESVTGYDNEALRDSVFTKDESMPHVLPNINTFIPIPKIEDTSFEMSGGEEETAKYTDLDNPESFEFSSQHGRGALPT